MYPVRHDDRLGNVGVDVPPGDLGSLHHARDRSELPHFVPAKRRHIDAARNVDVALVELAAVFADVRDGLKWALDAVKDIVHDTYRAEDKNGAKLVSCGQWGLA